MVIHCFEKAVNRSWLDIIPPGSVPVIANRIFLWVFIVACTEPGADIRQWEDHIRSVVVRVHLLGGVSAQWMHFAEDADAKNGFAEPTSYDKMLLFNKLLQRLEFDGKDVTRPDNVQLELDQLNQFGGFKCGFFGKHKLPLALRVCEQMLRSQYGKDIRDALMRGQLRHGKESLVDPSYKLEQVSKIPDMPTAAETVLSLSVCRSRQLCSAATQNITANPADGCFQPQNAARSSKHVFSSKQHQKAAHSNRHQQRAVNYWCLNNVCQIFFVVRQRRVHSSSNHRAPSGIVGQPSSTIGHRRATTDLHRATIEHHRASPSDHRASPGNHRATIEQPSSDHDLAQLEVCLVMGFSSTRPSQARTRLFVQQSVFDDQLCLAQLGCVFGHYFLTRRPIVFLVGRQRARSFFSLLILVVGLSKSFGLFNRASRMLERTAQGAMSSVGFDINYTNWFAWSSWPPCFYQIHKMNAHAAVHVLDAMK